MAKRTPPKRTVIERLKIKELSLVDKGAQEPGHVLIAKRDDDGASAGQPVAKVYISYYIGDRVRVLNGKAHMAHASNRGTVVECEAGVCAVLFDGETEPHRWYAPSEMAPLDPDEATEPVAMRAPAVKAEITAPPITITPTRPEETAMTDADRIKQLETDLAKALKLAELTDVEKAHAKSLGPIDGELFLAKPGAERRAIADEANKVIYKAADGSEYRRSDDPRMVEMAKRADASDREASAVKLEKRAGEVFKNIGGTLTDQGAILAAIDLHVTDAAQHARCVSILKANTESAAFRSDGVHGGDPAHEVDSDAAAELTKMAEKRASATGETVTVAKVWLLDNDTKAQALKKRADAERRNSRRARA